MDLALIAHAATLESRIPFLHFFDGFRTSHEVAKIEHAHRRRHARHDRRWTASSSTARARSRPTIRCCAARRRIPTSTSRRARPCNPFYVACPDHRAGRRWTSSPSSSAAQYQLFDYVGAPDAERVIVMMGSGAEAAHETVDYLNAQRRKGRRAEGPPVSAVLASKHFVEALPATVTPDRRARPHQGAGRDRRAAVSGRRHRAARRPDSGLRHAETVPAVVGGRYGLSSKEFTPAMVKARLRQPDASRQPKESLHRRHQRRRHATPASTTIRLSRPNPTDVVRAMFYGLGADGTVGANKNSIKIIGEEHRQLRAGLFRLRLEEVRRDDRLAPALRPAADPLQLPDLEGQLRRLPPVRSSSSATTC